MYKNKVHIPCTDVGKGDLAFNGTAFQSQEVSHPALNDSWI